MAKKPEKKPEKGDPKKPTKKNQNSALPLRKPTKSKGDDEEE